MATITDCQVSPENSETVFDNIGNSSSIVALEAIVSTELDSNEPNDFMQCSLLPSEEPADLFRDTDYLQQTVAIGDDLNLFQLSSDNIEAVESPTEWVLPEAAGNELSQVVFQNSSTSGKNDQIGNGQVIQVMVNLNPTQHIVQIIGPDGNVSASGFNHKESQCVPVSNRKPKLGRPRKDLTFYVCDKCMRQFDSEEKLKIHNRFHSDPERKVHCSMEGCPWSFATDALLQKHSVTHKHEKSVSCTVEGCGQRFTTEHNLQSHLKLHKRPQVVCPIKDCDRTFPTQKLYHAHLVEHKDVVEAPYKCLQCKLDFFSANHYGSHMRSHRSFFQCDHCDRVFTRQSDFKTHLRVHTGERPFACTFCHWSFPTSSKLTRHMRKHTQQRAFVCTEAGCGKSFLRSEHLRDHIFTHTGERQFNCSYPNCSASFVARSSLFVHLRKHKDGQLDDSGGIPRSQMIGRFVYPCPRNGCTREFKAANVLKAHMKLIHQLDLDKNLLNGSKKSVNADGTESSYPMQKILDRVNEKPKSVRKPKSNAKGPKVIMRNDMRPTQAEQGGPSDIAEAAATSAESASSMLCLDASTEALLLNDLAKISAVDVSVSAAGPSQTAQIAADLLIGESVDIIDSPDYSNNVCIEEQITEMPHGSSSRTIPISRLLPVHRRRHVAHRTETMPSTSTSRQNVVRWADADDQHEEGGSCSRTTPHHAAGNSSRPSKKKSHRKSNSRNHVEEIQSHDMVQQVPLDHRNETQVIMDHHDNGNQVSSVLDLGQTMMIDEWIINSSNNSTGSDVIASVGSTGSYSASSHRINCSKDDDVISGEKDDVQNSNVTEVVTESNLVDDVLVSEVPNDDLLMSDALITPHCSDVILTSSVTNDMLDPLYL